MKRDIMLILALVIASGCAEVDPHAGHDHSHSSHSQSDHGHLIKHTIWNDVYEAYLRHDPLVKERSSKFQLCLTKLIGYDPHLGEINYQINTSGKTVISGSLQNSSPGYYEHQEKLAAGKYEIVYSTLRGSIVVPNIEVFDSENEAETQAHHTTQSNPNAIVYEKEQAWATNILTAHVVSGPLNKSIATGGELVPAVTDEFTLASPAQGIVVFNKQLVPGVAVTQGETLYKIISGDMSDHNLQAHFLKVKARLEKATSNYERKKLLFDSNAISASDFESARLEYESAKAEYSTVSNNYSGGGKTVKAPSTGYISEVFIKNGAFTEEGATLGTIVNPDKLLLKSYVGTHQSSMLPPISATFVVNGTAHSMKQLNGKYIGHSKHVSHRNPKIPVFFEFNNSANFAAGTYVDVYLEFPNDSNKTATTLIQENALLEDYGKYSVVVQTSGETYEVRPVEVGFSNGIQAEILSGVAPGERIVTQGAFQIKMAQMSGKIPAHVH